MLSPEGKLRLQVRMFVMLVFLPNRHSTIMLFAFFIPQWHRETEVGSDMFVATQHIFWEVPKTVQIVTGGLIFDSALQVCAQYLKRVYFSSCAFARLRLCMPLLYLARGKLNVAFSRCF